MPRQAVVRRRNPAVFVASAGGWRRACPAGAPARVAKGVEWDPPAGLAVALPTGTPPARDGAPSTRSGDV